MSEPLIDLHLHTTASDGRCTPEDLVDQAWRAGIGTMSVTDHDTMAATTAASSHASVRGIQFIPGIEITSVHGGRDVHLLAYHLSPSAAPIQELLAKQRELRLERAREIATLLTAAGVPLDVEMLLGKAHSMTGKAIARPQIAEALVVAGHVSCVADAFKKYLGEGCQAYVPHTGASPRFVVELVLECGGVPSMAHPGISKRDEIIPDLVDAGLPCIEVYHSGHDEAAQHHYAAVADHYGLVRTGGSDYHGPGTRRSEHFGHVTVPSREFQRFRDLVSCLTAGR